MAAIFIVGPIFYGLLVGGLPTFLMPSESMSPTLLEGDRLFVQAVASSDLRRGDVVVFHTKFGGRQVKYVKRIAALSGDTIEVRNGVVWLNGVEITQTKLSTKDIVFRGKKITQRRLNERFPGEVKAHEIFDSGESVGDDFPPVKIPKAYVFMLGDNRDNSADSRFNTEIGGVGMVDMNKVFARATKIYWSKDSGRIGKTIN